MLQSVYRYYIIYFYYQKDPNLHGGSHSHNICSLFMNRMTDFLAKFFCNFFCFWLFFKILKNRYHNSIIWKQLSFWFLFRFIDLFQLHILFLRSMKSLSQKHFWNMLIQKSFAKHTFWFQKRPTIANTCCFSWV